MVYTSKILCLLILIPFLSYAGSNLHNNGDAIKLQSAIFNRDFPAAIKITKSDKYTNSTLPNVVKMSIYQAKMFENFNFNHSQPFVLASDQQKKKCETILIEKPNDLWEQLLCGIGDAMRSIYYLKHGQTLKGISHAKESLDIMEKIKDNDPSFIDVELGFAIYSYFKSELFETKLSFIPFVKDNRKSALRTIKNLTNKGIYVKDIARFALAYIALETNQKSLGEHPFQTLLKKYPRSIIVKNMYSAFLIKTKQYEKAITHLKKLIQTHPEITSAKYFLSKAYIENGQNLLESQNLLNEFIKTNPDKSILGPSYYLLGKIEEKQKNPKQALYYYQKSYDTYSKYKPAFKNLIRLKRILSDT